MIVQRASFQALHIPSHICRQHILSSCVRTFLLVPAPGISKRQPLAMHISELHYNWGKIPCVTQKSECLGFALAAISISWAAARSPGGFWNDLCTGEKKVHLVSGGFSQRAGQHLWKAAIWLWLMRKVCWAQMEQTQNHCEHNCWVYPYPTVEHTADKDTELASRQDMSTFMYSHETGQEEFGTQLP